MLFALDEGNQNTLALVAIAITAVANLVIVILAKMDAKKAADNADKAATNAAHAAVTVATKVDEVKVEAKEAEERRDDKLDAMASGVSVIKEQTNNLTAVHLREKLGLAEEVAKLRGDSADMENVKTIRAAYDQHVANQTRADAKK